MSRAISDISGSAVSLLSRPLHQIGSFLAAVWHETTRDMPQPYRPEQHYMRGPGPKWHAKHGDDAKP
ncbi:MAG: hypothetical protein WA792_16975 [Pseudolabrys sp.]